jgi:hypothetical protein
MNINVLRRAGSGSMTDFNPLAGAILGSAQIQQLSDLQKQRQLRRAQALRKNVAARADELDHQVESPEEPAPIHDAPDEHPQRQAKRDPRHPNAKEDGKPHIDVKA